MTHTNAMVANITDLIFSYIYRAIYATYLNLYDSTFSGKPKSKLQLAKDFYREQVIFQSFVLIIIILL